MQMVARAEDQPQVREGRQRPRECMALLQRTPGVARSSVLLLVRIRDVIDV
jgi:hypothetical protein